MSARAFGLTALLLGVATALPAQQARPAASRAARAAAARADSARDTTDSLAQQLNYKREVYNYRGGARDPFQILLNDASLQTSFSDLRLVSVIYAPPRSVAVVRENNNPRPYRVRVGDQIGRFHVLQIRQYEVVFQVEEFGFERQEVLALTRPEVNR